MSSMLDWALFYRSQNLSVIPVQGKVPLIKWAKYQEEIASEDEIKQWWEKWPEASVGMVTGRLSNRLIIDVDSAEAQKRIDELSLPDTARVQTKRGQQYHYRYPKFFEGKTTLAGLLPSTDVRGEGGFCVLPPSMFSDMSGRYSWISEGTMDIADCPQSVIQLLETANKPTVREDTNNSWLKEKLDAIAPGNRNQTFTSICGSLRSRGYSSSDIYLLLADKAAAVDFDLQELRTICESVGGYQPRVQTTSEAQSISDFLQDEQKVEWLVPGLISKGSIGFVAGLQETGKTWMLIDLAVEMARGGGLWLGKFETKAAKVLFVDQERHKSETQRRFKAVMSAKGIEANTISAQLSIASGTTTRLNLQQSFDAFRRKLNEIKPDVVMIDSWATFHTSSENDRTEIQKVLELVKQLRNEFGCSFIFINHESKSVLHREPGVTQEPHSADMMGSVAVPAAAEVVLTVRRKDKDSCMVYHTKSTMGPKIAPFQVTVLDVEGGINVVGS